MPPLGHLVADPPITAVGCVRRLVDGRAIDEAEFAYLAPDRWRVRHASGREIVSVGPDVWERPDPRAPWTHDRAEGAATVHHTGYLRSILLPRLHPPLSDDRSRVVSEEAMPDGVRRIHVAHVEPESGTMILDVDGDGRLRRIAGRAHDGDHAIELSADYVSQPHPDVFDPSTPWPPNDNG